MRRDMRDGIKCLRLSRCTTKAEEGERKLDGKENEMVDTLYL
jgi:hypothetical protein